MLQGLIFRLIFPMRRGKKRLSNMVANGGVKDKMYALNQETRAEGMRVMKHVTNEVSGRKLGKNSDPTHLNFLFLFLRDIKQIALLQFDQKKVFALFVNSANRCNCCHYCKSRLTRLQIMINELFSYISDYLPEEMQEVHQQPPPPPDIVFAEPPPFQLAKPIIRNKPVIRNENRVPRKETPDHLLQANRDKLPRKQPPAHLLYNANGIKFPSEGRRKFTYKDKLHIVSSIQAAIQRGQKIADACAKHNICDRSYQRWKKDLEQGMAQKSQGSNQDLIIQDPFN